MSWLSQVRALDRSIWALALARMVVTAGFSMVMPFLAIHLAVERNVPAFVVGGIWTVAGALGAVAQWLAGELADRIGRRPVMIAATLLRAVNLAGMGIAVAAEAPIYVIAALTVMNAVLRAFFDPVCAALVADLCPADQRVPAFSLQRVGINFGWALGPAVAALAEGVSYATLFLASAPLTLAATVVVWVVRAPVCLPAARAFSLREMFSFRGDRPFVYFLAGTAAFYILQVQLYQTTSIYAARVLGLSRADVGTFYTLNGILVVLLQLPAVHYIQRLGTHGALVVGCLGYAASYAAMGLAGGYVPMLGCIAAITLAEIVTSPAMQTHATSMAPPGRIGSYAGLFGLAQISGQSAGPLIGTAVLDAMPPRVAWFFLALFGVAAAVLYRSVLLQARATHKALASEGKA